MISVNFAPNEEFDDALVSLCYLFQPWKWQKRIDWETKKRILKFLGLSADFFVFFFLSGRSAWYHFLKILNLKKGAKIIVPGFTCEAVVLSILANKLKPIYVDIESKTFSLDFKDFKNKFTSQVKVVLLQHTFGLTPFYRQKIIDFCQKNNLVLIEDLAHGFGSKIFNSSQKFPSNFLLSFGRSKVFSSVFGGAIVTNQKEIAEKLKKEEERLFLPTNLFIFRTLLYKPFAVLIKKTYDFSLGKILHYLWKKTKIFIPEISGKEKKGDYDTFLDKAYPLILGKLLEQQLKKSKKIFQRRIDSTLAYNQKFGQKYPGIPLLRYPLLFSFPSKIIEKMARKKIFLGNWYNQVVAPKGISLEKMGYQAGSCPKAELICQKIINLPTNISKSEVLKIIQAWDEN
jgi:perosamine synthetase